jgi:hypothetical protein
MLLHDPCQMAEGLDSLENWDVILYGLAGIAITWRGR